MGASRKNRQVYVTGMGIVSPAGIGVEATLEALRKEVSYLKPVTLFEVPGPGLPVGEVTGIVSRETIPRAHNLALQAAMQAVKDLKTPPDAIVLGCTTGGITLTEDLLRAGVTDPERFKFHGTGTVAEWLAASLGCDGPAITVSTACSSGAVALKLALEMVRSGQAQQVLAGGVDALCRLTYHGFRMLQVVDPMGARPLDRNRAGMTVGEAAAMLLLTGSDTPPKGAMAVFSGGGLSCDAYHPSAPHPDGEGALFAMRRGMDDAGIPPKCVDYINLHGTGTRDNDAAESKAILAIYPEKHPSLSSTKGIFGHSLAASGAVEAVVSILTLREGLLPSNVGCSEVDPDTGVSPVLHTEKAQPEVVLSNSFGFGGNNAALVFSKHSTGARTERETHGQRPIRVLGSACISGAGTTDDTLNAFVSNKVAAGVLDEKNVTSGLPPRMIRRLRRLPKLALSMAEAAMQDTNREIQPFGVYVGTGWGPLSETYAFLEKLQRSGDKLSSPTDFVGSIHNAVSSQLAIRFKAKGPNITTTDGDFSFQQAVFAASLLQDESPFLLCGVDESHEPLSGLLDASVAAARVKADGGGALVCAPGRSGAPGPVLVPAFLGHVHSPDEVIRVLGGARAVQERFAAIFSGIPAAHKATAEAFLARFIEFTGFQGSVIRYRDLLGEFATVSAVAVVMAVRLLQDRNLPAALSGAGHDIPLQGKGILLLDLGANVSAVEVLGQV